MMTSRISARSKENASQRNALLHSAMDCHQVMIAKIGVLKSFYDSGDEEYRSLDEVERCIMKSADFVRKARLL